MDSVDDVDLAGWEAGFEEMFAQVAPRFAHQASRAQARAYLRGLLSAVERKNGWTLSEHAGDPRPDKSQRLLNFYSWDADEVRDDTRTLVATGLGEPDGVLVVDETGFLKKGDKSAGVQRQYSGTAGRIENCQLGVFLAYVSAKGRALVDRRLYVPQKTWIADRARCAEAGIGDDVEFATKPQQALEMIKDAWEAGFPFSWVAGDEVYGNCPKLARWLEEHGTGYVLAVACDRQVSTATGRFRVDELAAKVPARGWQTYAAADGSKGPRLYDWALVATTDAPAGAGPPRHVLVRRSRTDKAELAFFVCHAPRPVPLATFVTVAGRRWGIEECFQTGKNEVGLDHYQVRLYHAWYRHVTLAMLALAWLSVTASRARGSESPQPGETGTKNGSTAVGYVPGPDGLPLTLPAYVENQQLIPLTVNEIRRLHATVHHAHHPTTHTIQCSNWRRRHQATARRCHYQRRIRDERHPPSKIKTTRRPLRL